jgi:VanZ family protein
MCNSTDRRKFVIVSQIVLAGYWLALIVATHLPAGIPILPSERFDKSYHAAAYFVLALVLATTWQISAGYLRARHLFWTWAAVASFGVLDEITQIPFGRDCSIWDWLADIAGAALGLFLFVLLRRTFADRES